MIFSCQCIFNMYNIPMSPLSLLPLSEKARHLWFTTPGEGVVPMIYFTSRLLHHFISFYVSFHFLVMKIHRLKAMKQTQSGCIRAEHYILLSSATNKHDRHTFCVTPCKQKQHTFSIPWSVLSICWLSTGLMEFMYQKSNYSLLLHAILIYKAFKSRLWFDSRYVARQLDGIGDLGWGFS